MAQTIFPETGDAITQAAFSGLADAIACDSGFVVSGYSISDGGGLDATVAAGEAFVNGFHIEDDASTTVALTDASTNYIWLEPDGTFTDNTTGTNPGNAILLGTVVTSGGSISSISHLIDVTSGKTIAIHKDADTNRSSTATLAADPDLVFTAGKRTIYEFKIAVRLYGPQSAGDFRFGIVAPSGARFAYDYQFRAGAGGTSVAYTINTDSTNDTQLQTSGLAAPNYDNLEISAVVWVGDTAGSVGLQWAQGTSNGTASTVAAGSFMTARRIFG